MNMRINIQIQVQGNTLVWCLHRERAAGRYMFFLQQKNKDQFFSLALVHLGAGFCMFSSNCFCKLLLRHVTGRVQLQ